MRTKQELIDALSERTGQSKKDTADFVDSLGHLARECLAEGREVILPAIGKLTVKEKKARMGRNPQTGEAIEIAARKVPVFSPAKALAGFGDLFAYHYPLRQLATGALQSGHLPFWNPYIFCGVPLSANSQAALFYPLSVLGRILPLTLALSA